MKKTYIKIYIDDLKKIQGNEVILYSLIKSYNVKNKSFFMSRKSISNKYNIGEATTSRNLKNLIENNMISINRIPGKTNTYNIIDSNTDKSNSIKCYDVFFEICNGNEIIILSCILKNYNTLQILKNEIGIPERTIRFNITKLVEKELIISKRGKYYITDKTKDILKALEENKKEDNQEQEEEQEQEEQEESQEEHKEEVKENSSSAIICNFKILEKEEIKDIYNNMSKCQNALTLQEKINFIISLYNQKYTRYTACEMLTKEEYNKLVEVINNYDLSYIVKRLRAHLEDIKTKEKYNNSYQLRYVITNITHIKVRNNFTERLYFDEDIRELEKKFYI